MASMVAKLMAFKSGGGAEIFDAEVLLECTDVSEHGVAEFAMTIPAAVHREARLYLKAPMSEMVRLAMDLATSND